MSDAERELVRCMPYLERALSRNVTGDTLDDVLAEIRAGRAWFWPGRNAAAVTRIHEMRTMHIWLGGGDMSELKAMCAPAEDLGRAMGCTHLTLNSPRDGWARALRPLGWREQRLVLKDIEA